MDLLKCCAVVQLDLVTHVSQKLKQLIRLKERCASLCKCMLGCRQADYAKRSVPICEARRGKPPSPSYLA